jgi:hypothetical protein
MSAYTDADVQTCIDWLYSAMHDDRQIPEMAENLLEDLAPAIAARAQAELVADLTERLKRADELLWKHSKETDGPNRTRLEGKANGVRLALSYVEEITRAIERT